MKRYFLFYFFVIFVSISEFSLILWPVVAINKTRSVVAIEDSTISADDPISNFGGDIQLQIGYEFDWLEAFIKFDLSDIPKDFNKAILKLEWTYLSIIIVLEIYETSSNWSEYSITWDNAPQERILIASGIVENRVLSYEITEALTVDQDWFSICLTSYTSHWICIASRECSSVYNPPRIVFYTNINNFSISFTNVVIGLIIGIIFTGILGLFIHKRYYKNSREKREKLINHNLISNV